MSGIRFALRVPAVGPASNASRLIEATQEAESLGYDAVMLTDHLHKSFEKHKLSPPGSGWYRDPSNTLDPNHFEAVTSIAFLAGATRRIRLGAGVLALPLRDPVLLAKEIATLDVLSGGRLIVGVGVSNVTDREEYRALGRPFLPYAERYAQISEHVTAMRTIWEQPVATFHGRYVEFEDLTVYPKPARRLPIWIGCGSLSKGPDHPAVKFTLEHADGWIFPFLADADLVAGMIRDFRATATAVGRDLTGFEWCIQRRVSIGATVVGAHENVDWMTAEQTEMWRWAGYMHDQGPAGYQASLENATVGTPQDVRQMVKGYVDAGASMIEIVYSFATYEQLLQQMRLFAAEVMPAFR